MFSTKKIKVGVISFAAILALPGFANAIPISTTPVSGAMYYTTYSGGTNVHKVDFNFDGSALSLTNNVGIASVSGADGIVGDPNDANSLFVGGQGSVVHRVSTTGTLLQNVTTPSAVYHLEASNSSTLYGSSIPSSGSFNRLVINPDGSLGAATAVSITGDVSQLTQVITTPTGYYYTASSSGGFGSFGSLDIVGNVATTHQLFANVSAAHGGVYDPFTQDIILFGDGFIMQFDPGTSSFVSSLASTTGGTFDQGTVDGQGHIFAANNNGYMTFIDFTSSMLVGDVNNFTSTQYLAGSLDDIAPLVGAGTTGGGGRQPVPEPTSIALLSLGLLGLGATRRRPHKLSV